MATWKKVAFFDEVATTFVALSDTPADYTDDALKLLRVNAAPDAVEFVAQSALKLDDFGAGDDNTDLDATDALHGLMSKADKGKLDAVEASADVTDATNVNGAGAVMETDFAGAQSIMAATTAETPANLVVAEQEVVGRITGGDVDGIAMGIADNNVVRVDGADIADDEIARFTASGLESRTPAEVAATMALDDIGAPDAAVNLNGQQATDMVVHSVANAAARPTAVEAKIVHQQDDDHIYICTDVA